MTLNVTSLPTRVLYLIISLSCTVRPHCRFSILLQMNWLRDCYSWKRVCQRSTSVLQLYGYLVIKESSLMTLHIIWLKIQHVISTQEEYRLLVSSHMVNAVKTAGDISIKSWQRKWNQDVSGFYTRSLIPEVGRTVLFPQSCNTGISYCRMLLHDTVLRDDSHRTNTADTRMCMRTRERNCKTLFIALF